MLEQAAISLCGKNVMILGTGGTSLTALAVANDYGAKSITIVSRQKNFLNNNNVQHGNCPINYITYEQAQTYVDTNILLNTTPVGMYPNNTDTPIDILSHTKDGIIFPNLQAVADVIYNPANTRLILSAKKRKLKYAGGLPMLVAQAKYAAEIFTNTTISNEKIKSVTKTMCANMTNIVLIGMPGSGKSHIGTLVAKMLNRKLVDTDSEIVARVGCSIEHLFKTKGEEYFRKIESEICAEVSKNSSLVISTGGGIVLNETNVDLLHQNSTVFFINRDLEKLQTGNGRPLSKSAQHVKQIFEKRYDIYKNSAHVIIDNNKSVQNAAERIKEIFYENIDN